MQLAYFAANESDSDSVALGPHDLNLDRSLTHLLYLLPLLELGV